jgi:hypothetical protein
MFCQYEVCSFGDISIILFFVYSGFWFLFAKCVKAFAIIIGRKSCYRLGSFFRETKDVVACLILGLND